MPVIAEGTQFIMNLGTLIGVIFFAVGMAIKFTNLKNSIEYKVCSAEKTNEQQQVQINDITKVVNGHDMVMVEIRTKLANIEAMLLKMEKKIDK